MLKNLLDHSIPTPYPQLSCNGTVCNCKGLKGKMGSIGVPGVPGVEGLSGDHGPTGAQGRSGEEGDHGVYGSVGEKGMRVSSWFKKPPLCNSPSSLLHIV